MWRNRANVAGQGDIAQLHASVVVPIGSVDQYLEEQLRAVVAQRCEFDFEVVCALNRPGAAARSDLERMLASVGDERVRFVDASDRRGAAHARNLGASVAQTDRIAFCDADDVVEQGWLAALIGGLIDYDAVSGYVSEDRFCPPRQRHWRPPATPGSLPSFMGHPYLLSGNLAVRRGPFDHVGRFRTDLTRCEDIALSWTLVGAGYTLGYVPDAVLHYRHREGLWPMVHQHYLYGRGMSEVLRGVGVPGSVSSDRRLLFRANGQTLTRRTLAGSLRRGGIAAGRLRGMVGAGTNLRRAAPGG
jgi:cellulose synthase/poly-beta-1,6-N-acetylglucosamine synthase-like glycosyltransferase